MTSQLNPAALSRPAYHLFCGGYRLSEWLDLLSENITGVVRHHLRNLQGLDFPAYRPLNHRDPWTLAVNARLVPSRSNFEQLQRLTKCSQPTLVPAENESTWAAAVVPTSIFTPESEPDLAKLNGHVEQESIPPSDKGLPLLTHPHDLVRFHVKSCAENLEHRIQDPRFQQLKDGVFVAQDVSISDTVRFDTHHGPVVIDEAAQIGPFAYLQGPIYLGPRTRINEHASVKDCVCAGHTTKIGGEVEATSIECFTNKQHHGFLGHSYLGSWINLGAGTCNSDLKNTYGEVRMEYDDLKISTGMQFLGCIIGDYSKSAINTGIFTGKTIGVCSMLYGFITTNVPSFVNYARSFGQQTELSVKVMVETQKRMFERRNVPQRPCDIRLIEDMFEMTRGDRDFPSTPLDL